MTGGFVLGVALTVLSAVTLAVQSLAIRIGTRTQDITDLVAVMFGVNLLILLPIAGISAYPEYAVSPVALAAFVAAGILGALVGRVCYFLGIARLGASRTEPLKALLPLVAVGTAVLVLGEQVTLPLLVGVGLLIAGGLLVTFEARDNPTAPTGRRLWAAVSLPLAAAFLLGVDPVLTKIGLVEGTTPLVGVTIRVLAATAGFALYLGWRGLRAGTVPSISTNRWLVVASVANTLYMLTYYAALDLIPVSVVAPVLSTSTLFVMLGAALFLQGDERVTARLAAGAVLVVVGVIFVVQG